MADFYGTDSNDTLTGGSGDDSLLGFGGHDSLAGGAGTDTLFGYDGNDTLSGGIGNDYLAGSGGSDSLAGGADNDTYFWDPADPGNDTINDSGGSADQLTFPVQRYQYTAERVGNNLVLTALSDGVVVTNVTIVGHYGAGKIERFFHNGETYSFGEGLVGSAGDDWLVGTAAGDTMQGGAGTDLLLGGQGADSLNGGTGNDILNGGAGGDRMSGGAGADLYYVDNAGDEAIETNNTPSALEGLPHGITDVGDIIDTVIASVGYTLKSFVEDLLLASGTAPLSGTGNTLANYMAGNEGNNSLTGLGGNDTLFGDAGADTLKGGAGLDSMSGGLGNDTYYVDVAGDTVAESDIAGTGGIDTINSSVTRTLGLYQEKLILSGTAASGTGNTLANTLTGNTSANSLNGGAGKDTLIGNAGNDTLNGGTGNDRLTGGTGLDIFRFNAAITSNIDSITDFSMLDDAIQLENAIFIKLGVAGALSTGFFVSNATGLAVDNNDHVVYETDTGKLFYDADGNGLGTKIQIATLVGAPALTSTDFLVM